MKIKNDSSQRVAYMLEDIYTKPVIFIEPAFSTSIAVPHLTGLRLEIQAGLARQLNNTSITYRKNNYSIGLVLSLQELLKGAANPKGN